MAKNPLANAGDTREAGLISASGRSPGEGNGNPFHYSGLKNSIDRGAGRLQLMGPHRGVIEHIHTHKVLHNTATARARCRSHGHS